jgi:RimJ/RimL family protein N-acetyltransferase
MAIFLRTLRLLLREWREADCEPFAAISADPDVMAMLPKLPDRAASDAWIAETRAHWVEHGFGVWALEIPNKAELIGGVGFHIAPFPASFPPIVIAWRLARPYWGLGYAFEAARAVIDDSFGRLGFNEIVGYTTIVNRRSLALMERLGMSRDPRDDFDHPDCPEGHPLRKHVVYRIAPGLVTCIPPDSSV